VNDCAAEWDCIYRFEVLNCANLFDQAAEQLDFVIHYSPYLTLILEFNEYSMSCLHRSFLNDSHATIKAQVLNRRAPSAREVSHNQVLSL
jgi:hypothetical protein